MTWSGEFISALSEDTHRWKWRLVFLDEPSGLSRASVWRSHGAGASIAAQGVAVGGASVTPQTWGYTHGAWSVAFARAMDQGELGGLPRGALAQLRAGRPGWAPERYQPVALGVLRNVVGVPPNWRMDFWDILSGLKTRRSLESGPFPANPAQFKLFYNAGAETTITTDYALGIDTTMNVDDPSVFELPAGRTGIVRFDAANAYVTYTGISGSTLTGCSLFSGAATTIPTGSPVFNSVYLTGNPALWLMQVLTSTGDGTNGVYDDLPASWGYGLPAEWIDVSDINAWRVGVLTNKNGASLDMRVIIDAPTDDGIGVLNSILQRLGAWVAVRHGLITIRACQDPRDGGLMPRGPRTSGVHITDRDIIRVESLETYDPNVPIVYGHTRVLTQYGNRGAGQDATSLPAAEVKNHDLTPFLWNASTYIDQADGVRYRVQRWDVYCPERLVLICRPRIGQLVPGDLVDLTTSRIWGRFESTRQGYTARRATVMEAGAPFSSAVRVVLSILPLPSDESLL